MFRARMRPARLGVAGMPSIRARWRIALGSSRVALSLPRRAAARAGGGGASRRSRRARAAGILPLRARRLCTQPGRAEALGRTE